MPATLYERHIHISSLAICAMAAMLAQHVCASVTQYASKSQWTAAAPELSIIDFTGYAPGTFITDQYSDFGVFFTDGSDTIVFGPKTYLDSYGLAGNGVIHLMSTSAQYWIACDFAGFIHIDLYNNDRLVYSSSLFGLAGAHFGGLISTEPFDVAVIYDPFDGLVFIDNLYFGRPIPAPGAAALLITALAGPARRRL